MEEKTEQTKNEIVMSEVNEMQAGIFGGNANYKKATSLNLENDDECDMLLNGIQDADYILNDCIDKEIEVVGFYVTEKEVEDIKEATGELIKYKKHMLMLFDVDGKSYVTGSNSCYSSFINIIAIKGAPTTEHHLLVTPVKRPAKEPNHFYLKLKLVRK